MKKYLYTVLLLALIVFLLTACSCEHEWQNATCSAPVTCSKCGETAGEPLPHTWKDATCTAPKTCSVCGITEGSTTGKHIWQNASCTAPVTCSECGEKAGEPLPHTWKDATCTNPQTCEKCGLIEGEPNGHWWYEATCTDGRICTVCLAVDPESEPLGHLYIGEKCARCGETDPDYFYENVDVITVSKSALTIDKNTTISIKVTYPENNYPNDFSLDATYDDDIVEIEWGDWDEWTIPLTIIPLQNGTATIKISVSGDPSVYKNITVTVTGFDSGSSMDDEEYEKYVMAACAMNYFFETSKFPNTVCFKNVYFTEDNGAGNRLLLVEGYGENNFGGKSYAYVAAMIFFEPTSYPVGNYTNYELWNGMYVRTVAHNDNPYGYSMGIFTEQLDKDLLRQVYYELFDEYSVQFE